MILVFGYFGYANGRLNGQTVKTREIYEMLRERSGEEVRFADSQTFRRHPGSVLRFMRDMARCRTMVWLPAQGNLQYLFPLIWLFSLIFRFEIVYVVIGGWLTQYLARLPFHRKHLARIRAILCENKLTKRELEEMGYRNVEVIPNFRDVTPEPAYCDNRKPLRLVFMARVCRDKGIEVIDYLCSERGADRVTVDFYGQVAEEDREYFEGMVARHAGVTYHGALQPEEIVKALSDYDAMVLPTHYPGEGFPGSIMDAYRCGLPVVVTRWRYAAEFVEDGETGLIIDYDRPNDEIVGAVQRLIDDPGLLARMKRAAWQRSHDYTPDSAWRVLSRALTSS